MKIKLKKNQIIYWRWKKSTGFDKTFSKSNIQKIVYTSKGQILELGTPELWTNYPNRVLEKEIEILFEMIKKQFK